MPRRELQHDTIVGAAVPAAMVERLERVAPTRRGLRSEFIRRALARALDEAEQQAEQDRDRATV